MRESKHYPEDRWSDFVRGVVDAADREAMQGHLDSGCVRCRDSVRLLGGFAKFAQADAVWEVPSALVAEARELFQPPVAAGWIDQLEQLAAELVFEIRQEWQPAGVRSSAGSGQRLLFEAGDYSVDLNLEPSGTESREIVGQIASKLDLREKLEGVVVQVMSTGKTLGETATNRFGEFMIEYPVDKHVVLRFALKHRGQRIDLPLRAVKEI